MGAGPVDWDALETAIFKAVQAASGFTGQGGCYWEKQNAPRPTFDHCTLYHDTGSVRGAVDESLTLDNPAPEPGAEILQVTRAQTEFLCTVKAFTRAVDGNNCAGAILSRVRNDLSTESTVDTLNCAGLAVIDAGNVQNLSGMLETEFEGAAALTVLFRVADGTVKTATYIQTVGPIANNL